MQATFERSQRALEAHGRILESLSYERVLERGYALVTHAGAPLTDASDARVGDALTLHMRGGQLEVGMTAQTLSHQEGGAGTPKPNLKPRSKPAIPSAEPEQALPRRQKNTAPAKKPSPKTDPSQGSLF